MPSAGRALTAEEETKYGREVFIELAKSARIDADPYAAIMLATVKDRLEAKANLPFPVKLTLIHSSGLDAFTTPGGYVYVTTGLIGLCDKEEELAGVLAHEFAHIARRHIGKRQEKDKFVNAGLVAAMLLSALAPNPNVSGALMATGIASAQTLALKYSREDEDEADRVGFAIAEKAGYNGAGIADFLKKLRVGGLEKMVPQYLLTHPYSEERAVRIEGMFTGAKTIFDVSLFPFVAERMKILGSTMGPAEEEVWVKRYEKNPADPLNVYSLALVKAMRGSAAQAAELAKTIKSSYHTLFLGEILVQGQKFGEAIQLLKDEHDPIGRFFLARAYEGSGDFARSIAALEALLPFARTYPEIYQRLGMSMGRLGNQAGGYENLGRYYLETGKEAQAKTYLEKAIALYGINSTKGEELLKLLGGLKKKERS